MAIDAGRKGDMQGDGIGTGLPEHIETYGGEKAITLADIFRNIQNYFKKTRCRVIGSTLFYFAQKPYSLLISGRVAKLA